MSLNVLVVDDSAVIRSVVKKSISMSGMDVREIHEAANGQEALKVLEDQWIDIVFADLNMPVMSGEELIKQMSKDNLLVSVPVVIVSSDRNQARIDGLKELGIRAYLRKPFRPENFKEVVTSVLNLSGEETGEGK